MPDCCACNGGNCTHYGVPHTYCSKHDPADWYGTAIPIAPDCPQCAQMKKERDTALTDVEDWKTCASTYLEGMARLRDELDRFREKLDREKMRGVVARARIRPFDPEPPDTDMFIAAAIIKHLTE